MKDLLYRADWTAHDADLVRQMPGPILIIGASGFIGRNMIWQISQVRREGRDTWAGNPLWSDRDYPEKCHRFTLDVTNSDSVREAVKEIHPGTIINLASYGGFSWETIKHGIYRTNFDGVRNILEAIVQHVPDCVLVQAGSSSEYGTNCSAPKEDGPYHPNSDYAVSKLAAAHLIDYYGHVHGVSAVNLRLYAVYGPWEDRRRLIPTVIAQGLEGRHAVYGDPTISRDFVYIDDVIMAFVSAALVAGKNKGRSFNVGTGRRTRLKDVAAMAAKIFRLNGEPKFSQDKNRQWDLADWYGSHDQLTRASGWRPWTAFRDGFLKTVDWNRLQRESRS